MYCRTHITVTKIAIITKHWIQMITWGSGVERLVEDMLIIDPPLLQLLINLQLQVSLKSYKIPIQILIYKVLSTTLPTQTLPHTIFILNSPKMIAVIFKMEYYLHFCLPKVDHLMCVFPQKSICYSYFHLLFWNHTVKSMIHVCSSIYTKRR